MRAALGSSGSTWAWTLVAGWRTLLAAVAPGRVAGQACVGDCGQDGLVTVDELVTMVNIALGSTETSECTAGDTNQDGEITVNEIIAAVGFVQNSVPVEVMSCAWRSYGPPPSAITWA